MTSPDNRPSSGYSSGVNAGSTEKIPASDVPRTISATPDRGRAPLAHGGIPAPSRRQDASLSPRAAEPAQSLPTTPRKIAPERTAGVDSKMSRPDSPSGSGEGVTETGRQPDPVITKARVPTGKDSGAPGKQRTEPSRTPRAGQTRSGADAGPVTQKVTEHPDKSGAEHAAINAAQAPDSAAKESSADRGRTNPKITSDRVGVESVRRDEVPVHPVRLTKDTARVAGSQQESASVKARTAENTVFTVPVPLRKDGQVKIKERPINEKTLKIGELEGNRWYTPIVSPEEKIASPRNPVDRDLQIPDEGATSGALQEVLPDLRKYFDAFWSFQTERIRKDDGIMEMDKQTAFDQEVKRFCEMVDNVEKVAEDRPGRPLLVLTDVDEMLARVSETITTPKVPGLTDVPKEERTKEQEKLLEQVYDKNNYERLQLSPGAILAVNYLKLRYGEGIQFGTLSTKAQEGQDMYLLPMLNEVCPGAFMPEYIMSCRDGAADRLVPDVVTRLRAAKKADEELSLSDVLSGFIETAPEERTMLLENVIERNDGGLTDYDIKLLMMIRILDQKRREGAQKMKEGPTSDVFSEEWYDQVEPDVAIVMFEDVYDGELQESAKTNGSNGESETSLERAGKIAALHNDSSLRYILMSRYRLPDDAI